MVDFTTPPFHPLKGPELMPAPWRAANDPGPTLTHPSCILTDAVTIVIPVIYHINGMLYGGAHIPDPEEVAHLLFYF